MSTYHATCIKLLELYVPDSSDRARYNVGECTTQAAVFMSADTDSHEC